MTDQEIQRDIEKYTEIFINLQKDLLRLEGVISYLQNKLSNTNK
jgi:hypothetical protein